jgi:hypothetical protein
MIKMTITEEQAKELVSYIGAHVFCGDWLDIGNRLGILLDSDEITGVALSSIGVEILKR